MTFFLLLVLLAYAARVGGWLPAVAAFPAGLLGACLLPGAALAAAMGTPRSRLRDWIVAPALSPLLLGGVAALAILRGQHPAIWVHAAVMSAGMALVILRWTERRNEAEETPGRPAWLVGLGLTAVVACLVVPNPGLRQSSDAWFHTAVVAEIARAGIPPEDPYFAGMPLQYFWFYHMALIALRIATGLGAPEAMALLNLIGVMGCVVMAARIGGALGFSPAAGAWGGAILLLGMGGLIWVFFPVKFGHVFLGDIRGMQAVSEVWSFTPFTVTRVMGTLHVLHSESFMLRKFLIGTAVPWSLLLALIAWDSGLRLVREGDPRHAAMQALSGAGAFLVHTVVGGALVAALAAGGALTLVRGRGARGRGFLVMVLAAGALAACAPYLLSVMRPGERSEGGLVGFHLLHVLSLPVSLSGAALLSVLAFRGMWRSGEPAPLLFVGAAAACVAYGIFGRLPGANQFDKTTLVAFIPLALAGGFAVPSLWDHVRGSRRLRILFVVGMSLFLIPENVIPMAVFSVDSKAPELSAGERALYAWIGDESPGDAVFIDSADRADVLLRGPRRQYWGIPSYAQQWGYPREEMLRRRALRDAVYEGPLDAGQLDALRALRAPVFVVAREADVPGIGARLLAQPDLFRPVFKSEGIRVFEVRLQEPVERPGS